MRASLCGSDVLCATMATLQEVDAGIKELAAKIKSLKDSGTADPVTVKQLVVSQGRGLCSA